MQKKTLNNVVKNKYMYLFFFKFKDEMQGFNVIEDKLKGLKGYDCLLVVDVWQF